MRELSPRAVLLGLVLSIIMGAANVYLGLKVGMTVSASIPAAVLAMVLLRGVLRDGSILEANQTQTAASAGESLAAGIIFTMPAMVMIGAWQRFDPTITTLVAFSGGLLGVLFMIPLRRVFIVASVPELKFPEGVACAAVLEAGSEQSGTRTEAATILWGAMYGVTFKILGTFLGVLKGTLEGAVFLGGRIFYFGADMSVALLGVGIIVGLKIAVLIFLGGAFGWLVALPLLGSGETPLAPHPIAAAYDLWSTEIRYLGVGAMLVGGIVAIFQVRQGLLTALSDMVRTTQRFRTRERVSVADPNLSSAWMLVLLWLCVTLVGIVYFLLTENTAVTLVATGAMVVLAFFFSGVASYTVGLVGSSNSPVSGMTITTVLLTGVLILVLGYTGLVGMVVTLGVAAVVCCAACTSGDICNDLKTGQLVGATPRRQQLMQIGGIGVAAFVMAPVLQLLHDQTPGGIGGRELAAPQAQLFSSLVQGLFGSGHLPWSMVALGAAMGIAIVLLDWTLKVKEISFRLHLMPVAVGMYLPLGLSVPILAGGILAEALRRSHNQPQDAPVRKGTLLASGAIAGEALTGILIALLASMGIYRLETGIPDWVAGRLTMIGAIVTLIVFFCLGSEKKSSGTSRS